MPPERESAALRNRKGMTQRNNPTHARIAAVCIAVAGALAAALAPFSAAYAAEALLYVSPPTALVTIGEEFTIRVMINTGDEEINAAEGSLAFDEKDLELVAIETEGSIFSSWVTPPTYNAEEGRIIFSGATAPGKSFSGEEGLLFSVRVRALRNSASQVWFAQGAAVLAADGKATNILSQLRSGTYTLTSREVLPALSFAAQSVLSSAAQAGIIQSSTHPDPARWYATTTAFLRWELPEGAEALRVGVDQNPRGLPDRRPATLVRQMRFEDLPEGVSYFHLQIKERGVWGEVLHYPLRVDTAPPRLTRVEEKERSDDTDPRVRFFIEGEDALSGIAYYTVSVNGSAPREWRPDGEALYAVPEVGPGEHTLEVVAYDRAGNSTTTAASFVVAPLDAPVLEEVPPVVLVGNPLIVRGTTYPHGLLVAQVLRNGTVYATIETRADANGNFTLEALAAAKEGEYEISLKVRDEKGAESNAVATPLIRASQPKILLFGSVAVSDISMATSLIGAVALLGTLLWFVWWGGRRLLGRVRTQTREAREAVEESFELLEDDVARYARYLESEKRKRPLTKKERAFLAQLSRDLSLSEEHISRELSDIEAAAGGADPLAPVRIAKRPRRVR